MFKIIINYLYIIIKKIREYTYKRYTLFYLNWKSNFLNYNSYIVRQFLIYGQGIISL